MTNEERKTIMDMMKDYSNPLNVQVDGEHYKIMAIQPIEFCQRNNMNFIESNVVKYVCRHRNKNGARDIRKAIHNLQILLKLEYPDDI